IFIRGRNSNAGIYAHVGKAVSADSNVAVTMVDAYRLSRLPRNGLLETPGVVLPLPTALGDGQGGAEYACEKACGKPGRMVHSVLIAGHFSPNASTPGACVVFPRR